MDRHGLRLEAKVNVENRAGEQRVWYGLFSRTSQQLTTTGEASFAVVSR